MDAINVNSKASKNKGVYFEKGMRLIQEHSHKDILLGNYPAGISSSDLTSWKIAENILRHPNDGEVFAILDRVKNGTLSDIDALSKIKHTNTDKEIQEIFKRYLANRYGNLFNIY